MKQTDARKLFPKHKLVFTIGKVSVYSMHDTHRVDPVAEVELLVNGGSHLLVRSPKGKLARFAVVRSFANAKAVRKALESDLAHDKNKVVSEIAVNRAYGKVQNEDFDCCIDILADHFHRGVNPDQWPFLTVHAKNTYNYTGTKKPAEKRAEAIAAPVESKPEKKPAAKKPAAKKISVGQAIFRAMQEAPVSETAPKPAQATKPKKPARTKATPSVEAWSAADELEHNIMLDALSNATRRLAEINHARVRGISVKAYDAEKRRRVRDKNAVAPTRSK